MGCDGDVQPDGYWIHQESGVLVSQYGLRVIQAGSSSVQLRWRRERGLGEFSRMRLKNLTKGIRDSDGHDGGVSV